MLLKKLFLSGTLMTLLGCSDAASPGDLAVSIAPSAASFRSGEKLGITVTVINTSDREYSVTTKSCPVPFRVIAGDGTSVGPECDVFTLDIRNALVPPGGSFTYRRDWTGEKIETVNGVTVRTPLAPGLYLLRANVVAGELGVLTGGMAEVEIVR
jgi:hypothetical protein